MKFRGVLHRERRKGEGSRGLFSFFEIALVKKCAAFFTERHSLAVQSHMSVLATGRAFHVKGWDLEDVRILASGYRLQIFAVKG